MHQQPQSDSQEEKFKPVARTTWTAGGFYPTAAFIQLCSHWEIFLLYPLTLPLRTLGGDCLEEGPPVIVCFHLSLGCVLDLVQKTDQSTVFLYYI